MAEQKVLRFIAAGRPGHVDYGAGPMVAHYDLMVPPGGGMGTRAFIGRRLDPTQGAEFDFVDPVKKTRERRRHGVFVPHDESGEALVHEIPVTTPHKSTYVREARTGQILPADEFTAREMGLPWDPKKDGGGHYEKSAHCAWKKETQAQSSASPSKPAAPPPPAESPKGGA
jgi:hypothetical protein